MQKKILLIIILVLSKSGFSQSASIDTNFTIGNGFGLIPSVSAIGLQSDNKILVGGLNLSTFNGTSLASNFVRINPNGTLDMTFVNTVTPIYTFAQQTDGKILVGGGGNSGFNSNRLKRFNIDGTIDTNFSVGANNDSGFNNTIYKIALQTDGKVLVFGSFTTYSTTTVKQLVRLNSNGSLDTSFNSQINSISAIAQTDGVRDFTLASDGKIFVATNSNPTTKLIKLNSNGSLDNAFSTSFSNSIDLITIQNDEKILIASSSAPNNAELSRLTSIGNTDNTFTKFTIIGGNISSVNQLSSGKILLSNSNGAPASKTLVRLNSDGGVDSTFDIGIGFNNNISKVVIQPDGKIIVGGLYTTYNGTTKRGIIRLIGDSNLSVSESEIKKTNIYPNPVKETIYISNVSNIDYEIYDILGKKVMIGKSNENEINVGSLTRGTYLLKIKSEGISSNQKFIKE